MRAATALASPCASAVSPTTRSSRALGGSGLQRIHDDSTGTVLAHDARRALVLAARRRDGRAPVLRHAGPEPVDSPPRLLATIALPR